jgi:hypothetical protein
LKAEQDRAQLARERAAKRLPGYVEPAKVPKAPARPAQAAPEKKERLTLRVAVSHACPKEPEYPTVAFKAYRDPEAGSSWDGYRCPKCGAVVYVDFAFKPVGR